VGVLGFWYTILQVRKTKAAAVAAEEAANRVLNERWGSFRKLVAANAHRYLSEVNRWIVGDDWALAGLRAVDLADQLAQLTGEDAELGPLIEQIRTQAQVMTEKGKNLKKVFAKRQWHEIALRLQGKIDTLQRLFLEVTGDGQ
jgi:hypothetical protein